MRAVVFLHGGFEFRLHHLFFEPLIDQRLDRTDGVAQVSVVPFIVAGAFYYVMNLLIEAILNRVEKSMSYYS